MPDSIHTDSGIDGRAHKEGGEEGGENNFESHAYDSVAISNNFNFLDMRNYHHNNSEFTSKHIQK